MRVPIIGVSLLALIGCGTEDADGVFVSATWIYRTAATNAPVPAPPDYQGAVLHARTVDGSPCSTETREPLCSRPLAAETPAGSGMGAGTSARLVPSVYDVWIELVDGTGVAITTTVPGRVDLTLGDKSYARPVVLDGGVFQLAWTLRATDGSPRTCEQADVAGITITLNNEADPSAATSDELECKAAIGVSSPTVAGSYIVSIEAVNPDHQTQGLAETLTGQLIVGPNGITDLGTVDVMLSSGP